MAEAYNKGKAYELHVAKLLRRKIGMGTMRNRSSHTGGTRRSDVFTELPLHIEAKHHKTVHIKEWMAQAEAAKVQGQTAVVAFRVDENDYACLRLSDLADLFVRIRDLEGQIEDFRLPTAPIEEQVAEAVERKKASGSPACRAGHIADEHGYCLQKGCKFSRNYKPPKTKRG